jgi:AcrR family transcriptional regulator
MATRESKVSNTRSDKRIPKLRTRGRANRQKLLAEAERMMEKTGGQPVRFSDIFEAAGVSRGSAYRIYNGVDDLMQDLASEWINNFVVYLKEADIGIHADSWTALSDKVVQTSAAYWFETEETLRVLPRVRSNVPESYKSAVKDLTRAVADVLEQHFVVPEIPDWLAVVGMWVQLADTVFTDAVRREGRISESRLAEAQKICSTYLSIYLPAWLPSREDSGTA